MKKLMLTVAAVAGMAVGVQAQGILLDNTLNSNPSSAATSGGLVWINNGVTTTLFDGFNYNLGLTVLAGNSSGSLAALANGTVYPGLNGTVYTGNDIGKFQQNPSVTFDTGVGQAGSAWVQIEAWTFDTPGASGSHTYAGATGAGDYRGTVTFQNNTSKASPPVPDQPLTGMPALILSQVPEPATFAIVGLGLGSLLLFRRRK